MAGVTIKCWTNAPRRIVLTLGYSLKRYTLERLDLSCCVGDVLTPIKNLPSFCKHYPKVTQDIKNFSICQPRCFYFVSQNPFDCAKNYKIPA